MGPRAPWRASQPRCLGTGKVPRRSAVGQGAHRLSPMRAAATEAPSRLRDCPPQPPCATPPPTGSAPPGDTLPFLTLLALATAAIRSRHHQPPSPSTTSPPTRSAPSGANSATHGHVGGYISSIQYTVPHSAGICVPGAHTEG